MPPISIFIPAKNESDHIGNLLVDLGQQEYAGELEIVVYDAGSSDGTQAITKQHNVEIRSGGPVNEARNKGMDVAAHNLAIMLDADTRVAPNFVSRAVLEFRRRNLDIATAWNIPFVQREINWYKKLLIWIGWTLGQIYQWVKQFSITPRLTSTFVIMKRSAWQAAGGFDEEVYRGGDTEFVIRAVQAGCRYRFLNLVSVQVSARKALTIGILRYFLITMRMNRVLANERLTRRRYEAITGDRNYFSNK